MVATVILTYELNYVEAFLIYGIVLIGTNCQLQAIYLLNVFKYKVEST